MNDMSLQKSGLLVGTNVFLVIQWQVTA